MYITSIYKDICHFRNSWKKGYDLGHILDNKKFRRREFQHFICRYTLGLYLFKISMFFEGAAI